MRFSKRAVRLTAWAAVTMLGLMAPPLSGDAMAQDAAAPAPSPADVATATSSFRKGNQLFKLKQWDKALTHFQKSYDAVASPNSLLYIARCKLKLDQHIEAFDAFQQTIEQGKQRETAEPKYKPTRETAELELGELTQKHVAVITVIVDNPSEGARVTIDGDELPREKWGQMVAHLPGDAIVVMEAPGLPAQSEELVLSAGDSRDLSFDAAPPPEREAVAPPPPVAPEEPEGEASPLLIPAIVAGGVGVVGMGIFTVAGILSNGTFDDLEAKCGGPCPDKERELDLIDAGKTEQTVANIGLVVGVLGLATGATLFIVSLSGGSDDGPDATAEVPATQLEVRPGFVGVTGAF